MYLTSLYLGQITYNTVFNLQTQDFKRALDLNSK